MPDSEDPYPELHQFLRDRAGAFDRDAAPISAEEAAHRVVTHSLEPARRWTHTPAAVAVGARRRPAVAAAVIAALLVGSLGGFAAGRGSAPTKHASVAARGAAQDSSTASTVVSRGFSTAAGAISPNGFDGVNVPQMARLFLRTTSEGVTVRGYRQTNAGPVPQPMCDPSSWCPPAECNPTTYFMAELSSAEAVAQNGSPEFPLDAPAASMGQTTLGQMEGAPVSSYMVHTNSDVVSVRATWPDGFVDEMQPANGWAIVAHDGSASASKIEAVLKDGTTYSIKNIDAGYPYPSQCQPPPPPPPQLPPAGSEQPADAESARADVTAAYQYVFTNGNDPTQNGNYVEDADNLKKFGDQAKANFPQASDTITVTVGEIRFLSATDAALYFELNYQGGALFGQQIGYAKLIDGHWKIARDTMCMVFSWAGAVCDPPPDPARSSTGGNGPTAAKTEPGPGVATTVPNN